jgi:oxygen-independent coproporphyrinogen-3 oxidase
MGLGPSAWSYLDGVRMKNTANLYDYCFCLENGESPACFSEKLLGKDLESEAAILALRTRWGIRFQRYRNRFGEERLEALQKKLDEIPQHLLVRTKASVSLSKEGMRVGNSVWEFFLP